MDIIFNWVKSGLIFGIFASVILMIAPNKSYMKHIGMVVGLLFLLVMVHPIMRVFHMDSKTYSSYIKNAIRMSYYLEELSDENIDIYEESLEIQLKAILRDNNIEVYDIKVEVDDKGNLTQVDFVFEQDADYSSYIERNLRMVLGEDVKIGYELR